MAKKTYERIILGLKIRQLRQELALNFEDLSRKSGISISYLNEIEKAKKYPQPQNLQKLADALGVSTQFLTNLELSKQYGPLGDLLQSNFLNELPLDLFGIELPQVVEIIARAPERVNAFISALLEIARNYSVREENFFFAALRAYQELHLNYFEDIEHAVDTFMQRHNIPIDAPLQPAHLIELLRRLYGYKVDEKGLQKHPELMHLRSVYNPNKRRLYLNDRLNQEQSAFQLGKELGFNVLELHERPYASSLLRVKSFEEVLNNYKAAYFSVALLVNRHTFSADFKALLAQQHWDPSRMSALMDKYQVGPEVLFQRFNIIPRLGLDKVIFQRFIHDLNRNSFDIDKELHLNRRHQPHATGLNEHYCRRWLSLSLLQDLQQQQAKGYNAPYLIGIQRATFLASNEEYLVLAVAKPGYPTPHRNVSVALGILLDDNARRTISFWDDPAIPRQTVNITCQRCAIADCTERAAAPVIVQRREERRRVLEALKKVTGN
jgi:XRE family transcriptional regulator, fatty acid utilization regulator